MIGFKPGGDSDSLSQGLVPPTGRNSVVTRLQCNGVVNVSSSRQKAVQAVEYYNSNLGKARCSYNDRYNRQVGPSLIIYFFNVC